MPLRFVLTALFFFSIVSCENIIKEPQEPLYELMDTAEDMLDPLQESVLSLGNTLDRLVIHCTAQDIRWPWDVDGLINFFKYERGWSKPGYTFFIDREGILWKMNNSWDWDEIIDYQEITYGAKGFNSSSLHIVWDGGTYKGKNQDNRTEAQKLTLRNFVIIFHDHFPNLPVVGHTDLHGVDKACPLFNVEEEFKDILN